MQKIPVSGSIRSKPSLSGQVFEAVNSYRRCHGKPNLQRHAGLDRLAQEHSEYLRRHRGNFGLHGKNVSHYGSGARSLAARERYQMMSMSENVGAATAPKGQPGPTLVKLWAGSKDHDHNMLSAWTHSGIGVAEDQDGTVFSTQLFATVSISHMELRNRFVRF